MAVYSTHQRFPPTLGTKGDLAVVGGQTFTVSFSGLYTVSDLISSPADLFKLWPFVLCLGRSSSRVNEDPALTPTFSKGHTLIQRQSI